MHRLIEILWHQHGFTALLVTLDASEAVALADRVLLTEDHRISLDQRIALPGRALVPALLLRIMRPRSCRACRGSRPCGSGTGARL
jgi:ABC-type nitrate/sulfonate/bicarbonate transport system ATPase subunit